MDDRSDPAPGSAGDDDRAGADEPVDHGDAGGGDSDRARAEGGEGEGPVPLADESSGRGPVPALTVFPPPDFVVGDHDGEQDGGDGISPSRRDAPRAADDLSFAEAEAEPGDSVFDSDGEEALDDPGGFDAAEPPDPLSRRPAVFLPEGGGESADDPGDNASVVIAEDPDGDSVREPDGASESALFNAVVDESTAFEGVGSAEGSGEGSGGSESFVGDSQGVTDGIALAHDLATLPGAGARRPRRTDDGGALRQLPGIVLGGLLSIPVAYAILLWGFHRDPFRVGAALPEGMRFLVPAKVRGASGRSRLPSLDRLPPPPGGRGERGTAFTTAIETAGSPAEPAGIAEVDPETAIGTVAPLPAEPATAAIDRAGLTATVARATSAARALDGVADDDDRRPELVEQWYRAITAAAAELVVVDNSAAAAGRPLPDLHRELAEALPARIGEPGAFAPLGTLPPPGAAAVTDGDDGLVVTGTLTASTRRGGMWSSAVILQPAAGGAAAAPRSVVVVSRHAPAAQVGDSVVVAGIPLADGVVWGAAVWHPAR